jgi:hypothetical protein
MPKLDPDPKPDAMPDPDPDPKPDAVPKPGPELEATSRRGRPVPANSPILKASSSSAAAARVPA